MSIDDCMRIGPPHVSRGSRLRQRGSYPEFKYVKATHSYCRYCTLGNVLPGDMESITNEHQFVHYPEVREGPSVPYKNETQSIPVFRGTPLAIGAAVYVDLHHHPSDPTDISSQHSLRRIRPKPLLAQCRVSRSPRNPTVARVCSSLRPNSDSGPRLEACSHSGASTIAGKQKEFCGLLHLCGLPCAVPVRETDSDCCRGSIATPDPA
jgi:hypothetical protein